MDIRNTFLAGRMNKDADIRMVKPGEYRDALNIRIANSEGSDVGAIEKSLGNNHLTSLSLGANADTICSLADEFEDKIYWAVVSDTGCYLIEYDYVNDQATKVLEDERIGDLNVLGFDATKLMQMVLIIDYDNGNRLLAFTDNNSQPKLINIERAKSYGLNGFNEEMLLLVKKPPLYAPTIVLDDTVTEEENNIEEKFITIFYRYKYLDGEYSAISPSSSYGFRAKRFNYDFATQSNESMINNFNKVSVSVNTGNDLITDVDVIYKESGSNNLYLIESFNKTDKGWANNTIQSFDFSNNKILKVLPEKELYRLYDNVPLLAKAIAVINNRVVFGNYTENYNLIDDLGEKVVIDFEVEKINTPIVINTPTESLKAIRDYEILLAYIDDYGRMTTPLTCETNTAYISNPDCITKNELQVTIKHKPPVFAKYFRFFYKQNRIDYDSLVPTLFYQDGVYVWIKLEGGDKDKVKEGDFLYVKADSQEILNPVKQTKVLEVVRQERNFLEDSSITAIIQQPGLYYKIKPDGFRINEEDFVNYNTSSYDTSKNKHDDPISGSTFNVIEPAIYYGTSTTNDMLSSGNYTGTTDTRYLIEILNLGVSSVGTVTLDSGTSGSVDSITVNGIEIMSGAVVFDTDLDTTAGTVAANITTNTSAPNYTATAVGPIISITSVTPGNLSNGYVVVSSTTTIVSTDVNMSGGSNDTFRWSKDNGFSWNDNGGNGFDITGIAQSIELGIDVTFTNLAGHDTDDTWIVSAKFATDNNLGNDENSKAYAILESVENDVIEGGARITITYDEGYSVTHYFSEPFIASRRYENIEEWFYRDNINDDFTSLGISDDRYWFRRGIVTLGNNGSTIFTQDNAGRMVFLIRTSGTQNNDSDTIALVRSSMNIFQIEQNIILETKPIDNNSDIVYEIGQTYTITNNYHIGNGGVDINQSSGVDAVIRLPLYNCFSWGNGFESYKIKDLFNAKTMVIDYRPSTPIENYKENKRIASITYSNVYEQTTNYNALNEFNLSLLNFKDLDDKYGAIQRMVSWNTDLDVYQDDKVHKVYYDKSVIYNTDGTSNLAKSNNVLDGVIAYAGEYGISTNGESLAIYGNWTYWADWKRGVVLRKGRSGIEVISNFGMRDWFRDNFREGDNIKTIGCYDPYFGQYTISINGYTLTFDEKVKGWTSFHSYLPDSMVGMNNRFFSFKHGQLYLHNDSTISINTFYGIPYSSKIKTIFNKESQYDKIFKTIIQESLKAWSVSVSTNLANSTIRDTEFNQRESRWFGYIRQNENTNDLRGVGQGIGSIISASALTITFGQISRTVSIGDDLYKADGAINLIIGTITDIDFETGIITVDDIINTPTLGWFAYAKKNSRIEGKSIRGYYMEVELEDDSLSQNELFAVSSNVVKSYL